MPMKHCLLLNSLRATKFQYAPPSHTNTEKKKLRLFFLIGPVLISAEIRKIEIKKNLQEYSIPLASTGLLCTCASTLALKVMRFSTLLHPDRIKHPEKYT